MAYVSDVLITYENGTQKIIPDVQSYGIYDDKWFFVKKNDRQSFYTQNGIVYFGNNFDYNEQSKRGY